METENKTERRPRRSPLEKFEERTKGHIDNCRKKIWEEAQKLSEHYEGKIDKLLDRDNISIADIDLSNLTYVELAELSKKIADHQLKLVKEQENNKE